MAICRENKCGKEIYFAINAETDKTIPVDADSMTQDEIDWASRGLEWDYDKTRHISHYKTCTNPNRFSKRKK